MSMEPAKALFLEYGDSCDVTRSGKADMIRFPQRACGKIRLLKIAAANSRYDLFCVLDFGGVLGFWGIL
jgi:hypothetical protein